MIFSTLISALTVLPILVNGSPLPKSIANPATDALQKRYPACPGGGKAWCAPCYKQNNCDKDGKSGIAIGHSDGSLNVGAVAVGKLIGQLSRCYSVAGTEYDSCPQTAGHVDTYWADGTDQNTGTVKVLVDGQFKTWAKNGFIDALTAAITHKMKVKHTTWQEMVGSTPTNPPEPIYKTRHVDEHLIARSYSISLLHEPAKIATISFATDVDDGTKQCEEIMQVGAAVAGAVSGVAGGIFALGELMCSM